MIYLDGFEGKELHWIIQIAPVSEDVGSHVFYGPNVVTVKIFTDTSAVDIYDPASITSDPDAKKIIDSYDSWDGYAVLVYLDLGAKDPMDPDPFDRLDDQLGQICNSLKDQGFQYRGILDSSSLNKASWLQKVVQDYYDQQAQDDGP